jgi:hypothetical protein
MPTRKPNSIPWIGVVVLAMLIGGYVAWYYRTVKPIEMPGWTDSNLTDLGEVVFAPIHWIDRRVRPHVWEPRSLVIRPLKPLPYTAPRP